MGGGGEGVKNTAQLSPAELELGSSLAISESRCNFKLGLKLVVSYVYFFIEKNLHKHCNY